MCEVIGGLCGLAFVALLLWLTASIATSPWEFYLFSDAPLTGCLWVIGKIIVIFLLCILCLVLALASMGRGLTMFG